MRIPLLDFDAVLRRLEGLEESIITSLLERAQFPLQAEIYGATAKGLNGDENGNLLASWLAYREKREALCGLFDLPEERPFTKGLAEAEPETPASTPWALPGFEVANVTGRILEAYLSFIPAICEPGGASNPTFLVLRDIDALKLISRRIHYGSFYVAAYKYTSAPGVFAPLIRAEAEDEIERRITRKDAEDRVVERVTQKAGRLQQGLNRQVRRFVEPGLIARFYREAVIPLTKQGEVLVLLKRHV